MTKDQLSSLPDEVRLPAEVLLDQLKTLSVKLAGISLTEDSGCAFFFENQLDELLKLTADIEIDPDGTVTASVIPFIKTSEGWDTYQSIDEPVEVWEVEEPPPFDETLALIITRLRFSTT